jgi:uncharacterized protein (TIGR03067 family)
MTRRRLILLVVSLAVVGPLTAADKDKEKDEDRLQGSWSVTATTFDGKAVPEDQVKGRKLTFKGKEFTSTGGPKERTLSFTLEPGKDPRRIDMKRADQEQAVLGIYKLDGDELTICYGEPGKERPTKFKSEDGGRLYLMVLKRDKK